ncbi:intraflagellar transport protein 52 homolog [Rhopalosiphum padi]|uniref:intraflagellar transport protein 52 homolog n=1 Tax=Rhopalosiphum padi TaxID=40932 RepID=UPI00298EB7F8|nr:intraflagellar transport protein 52 homolog [Rhopalosiphum padi]
MNMADSNNNIILFDMAKNEMFDINDNLKILRRKLQGSYTIAINKHEITVDVLNGVQLVVFGGPRAMFSEAEFNCLHKYIDLGGSVLVMFSEGGEKELHTNINYLLEEFGIMVNSDYVLRTHYYLYFHPKECLVKDGVVNEAVAKYLDRENESPSKCISFVFPYGASLNVAKPAAPILTSGSVAYPLNRPLCAFYSASKYSNKAKKGKLAVIGSGHLLTDKYINWEENDKIREILFDFLITNNITLNEIDANDPETSDYKMVPDIGMLSSRVRTCLQLQESLNNTSHFLFSADNINSLIDTKLCSLNTSMLPDTVEAYKTLSVPHNQLQLIPPTFNDTLPVLQFAVYPPPFQELSSPFLELFDLDSIFGSEKSSLANLAKSCLEAQSSEKTIEDNINQFIIDINDNLEIIDHSNDCKEIIQTVFSLINNFKK